MTRQYAVKVRISKSAADPDGLIEAIIGNLAAVYGSPRIRRTDHAVTLTWEGFEIGANSDRSGLSLIGAVLMLTDESTIKVYGFTPPRRNPSKREFRADPDKYLSEIAARRNGE